jgi:hypothetical protein
MSDPEAQAKSLVASLKAELEDTERLAIVLDTGIGNLEEHAYELMKAIEEMAEKEGFKGRLDIITGEGIMLRERVDEYMRENKNAKVRGIIDVKDQRHYDTRFARDRELSKRIRLVAVDDEEVPNADSSNMQYIYALPIIESSLGETIDPRYIQDTELTPGEEGSIITSIRKLLKSEETVPIRELEKRFREDAEFLRNA